MQREMANRLSAGRQPGENIQKPVATQQGLSLQSSPPESLTHRSSRDASGCRSR